MLNSSSATDIRLLGARHFTTHVQTVIAAAGEGNTRIRASWRGEWDLGMKPRLLAGQVSGGAEKGVPTGYRQLHETLCSPKALERHREGWKDLKAKEVATVKEVGGGVEVMKIDSAERLLRELA